MARDGHATLLARPRKFALESAAHVAHVRQLYHSPRLIPSPLDLRRRYLQRHVRLADSLPGSVLSQWQFERRDIVNTANQMHRALAATETARLQKLLSERIEAYLDASQGACWLQRDDVASIVAGSLQHFDGARYRLFVWCIMPNHVHAVVQPLGGFALPQIVHSWKSYSAGEANRLLARTGQFWQPESYDHLIRDEDDFRHQVEYVASNPARAGLKNWKWVGVAR